MRAGSLVKQLLKVGLEVKVTYDDELLEALALAEEGVDLGLGSSVHQEAVLVDCIEMTSGQLVVRFVTNEWLPRLTVGLQVLLRLDHVVFEALFEPLLGVHDVVLGHARVEQLVLAQNEAFHGLQLERMPMFGEFFRCGREREANLEWSSSTHVR